MRNLFLPVVFFVAMMFGATACSDDEKDDWSEPPTEDVYSGQWQEKDGKLLYTVRYEQGAYSFDMTWTLEFDDADLCKSSKCVYTFSSAQLADLSYEEMKADESLQAYPITKSGKTVTVDFTSEHNGTPKSTMQMIVEAMSGGLQ